MGGFANSISNNVDCVFANNADFSGSVSPSDTNGLQTNGQLWVGSTALNGGGTHVNVGAITSPLGTVSIGYSTPNITLDIAGGSSAVEHLTGDTGGQLNPTANNFNTVGSGSITIAGSGSTLTTQLTGLTNHAVLVGAGTTTITKVGPTATSGQVLQSAGAAADPAFSTATYPSTTTISQLLYSSSANVVSGLATANKAVLTTGATGIPVLTALATDGQLIIGSTAGVPAAATLTAGTGVSIANGSNSITISVSASGFTWTDVTGATQTIAVQNGYLTDRGGGVTYTLPATASIGDTFKIVGKLGLATITPNANQQLLIGSASGTVGATGTAVSNNVGDCIEFVCTTSGANTIWRSTSVVGTWTLN